MVPHVVVIDDDPVFLRIMEKLGSEKGIPMTLCRSLKELSLLTVPQLFDVAVIDFYLDGLKEKLTGSELASWLKGTPVILISGNENDIAPKNEWPSSIKGFVSKEKGAKEILAAALLEGKTNQLRFLV
jgi:CheY-like chemotaxis protein